MAADDDGMRPRDELFAGLRSRFAVDDPVADLIDASHREHPAAFEFPADSRDALRRLRSAGWKLAVVTNGPQCQERKLEVARLRDEVDAVCVSALVDSWKPDPRIFEEAARRCGVGLEGWTVGDSGPADIRGDQGVGLRTIWFHRGRTWDLGGPETDAQVSDVPAAVRVILGEDASG